MTKVVQDTNYTLVKNAYKTPLTISLPNLGNKTKKVKFISL